MESESVQPYNGPVVLDFSAIKDDIKDLKQGFMQFLRSEKEGMQHVVDELAVNVPAAGAKAAISPDVYKHFTESRGKLTEIRAAFTIVAKLAEVLEESEAYYENECEIDISQMCDAVRSSAHRRGDSILASFETMLRYNGQSAEKGARTRRKNAKEAEAKAEAEADAKAKA